MDVVVDAEPRRLLKGLRGIESACDAVFTSEDPFRFAVEQLGGEAVRARALVDLEVVAGHLRAEAAAFMRDVVEVDFHRLVEVPAGTVLGQRIDEPFALRGSGHLHGADGVGESVGLRS